MEKLGPNYANSSPLTPLGFLERTATVSGNLPSIVYNSTVYTWAQTHDRCLRLASALSTIGISAGDIVSVLAPNTPAMYEMHFGVPMSGAVLNTINLRLDARTVSVLLGHCGSKLLFVDPLSWSLAQDALLLLPANQPRPRLVLIDDDEATTSSGDLLTYERLIETGNPNFEWVRPRSDWSPMVLNYTSGTTSSPKGVVHCHRGLFLVTVNSIIDWSVPNNPIYLWTLPMFHANGWTFPWGVAALGGTNICLRKFDAASVYSAIHAHNVTHLCCAPVVLNMLANAPDSDRKPLPLARKVRILTAGAPPPAAVLHRAEALGFDISHGYGLTETAGLVVSCAWKGEWDRLPASERARMKARQGVRTLATAGIDVIDGASGKSVVRDGSTLGEIVLRGGCVMLGYLKDEQGTNKSVRPDGWFYTGDVGVMHPDGYVEIRDRSKDVIISGGENLSSIEVESALYLHPAVNEAAVVARPDEFWGETPCAFVSLKQDARPTTEEDIIKWCRERMPRYMVPKTVFFKPELPKTSTGKIQKYILREIAKGLGGTIPANKKSKM